LRVLHYRLIASTALKPDGEPCMNTGENWQWLQTHPAKAGDGSDMCRSAVSSMSVTRDPKSQLR
jgi:hypothetical protein